MTDQRLARAAPRVRAFTRRGFTTGVASAWALAANSAVYGVIFGALAAQARFDLPVAAAMSALVYAGGAQVASLQIWANPIPFVAVWAATLAGDARYILRSASLRARRARASPARIYGTLFTLSDGGWALTLRRWQNGAIDGGFLLGTGVAQYPAWVGGTVLGHVLGNRIGSPAAYGLDFIFPAFFAAMAAGLWTKRSDVGPVVAGARAALLARRLLSGH